MKVLEKLDWAQVREHYDERKGVHRLLGSLSKREDKKPFVNLLLGIDDPAGNYSAAEHRLGHKILASNGESAVSRVCALAGELQSLPHGRDLPAAVQSAGIKFLGVSVGSEAACLLDPLRCWITNTRTVWAHLLDEGKSLDAANEALRLYRQGEKDSPMEYKLWAAMHPQLETSLTRIAKRGADLAKQHGTKAGAETYLWADAISNALYAQFHE